MQISHNSSPMPLMHSSASEMLCSTPCFAISQLLSYSLRYKWSATAMNASLRGRGTGFVRNTIFTKRVYASIYVSLFSTLHLFEQNLPGRRGLHDVWPEPSNDCLRGGVFKRFSTLRAEARRATEMGKGVMASTTPAVSWKRSRTPVANDVDVITCMEPGRSSEVANLVRKGPFSCKSPTALPIHVQRPSLCIL